MASLATIMDRAARECSVTPPTGWVAATTLTHVELKDFLAETAEEVLDRLDLPNPITNDVTITGDGSASYSLPSDFKRLVRDDLAVYEPTKLRRACVFVPTNGAWTHMVQTGSAGGNRYFRTAGDESSGYTIEFYRPLESGSSAIVSYVTKNWLKTVGVAASSWALDEDTPLIPEQIIRLGVVWRFRRRKGMPYSDLLAEYALGARDGTVRHAAE